MSAPDSTLQPDDDATASDASDETLMRAAQRGDASAFARLVARHQADLYAIFRRLGADGHSAEDCVQETFLRLLRSRRTWLPRAPFRAFLLVLARNTFVDWSRRRRARPAQPLPPADDGTSALHSALHVLPLELPFDHAPQDVRDALAALPETHRLVVQLSVWQGLRHRDIALVLDIPEGTVKSRMHNALARLREALQRDAIS